MRLDKYLKVSRIIKRRTVANDVCGSGRVTVNGKDAKPGVKLKEGDIVTIRKSEQYAKMLGLEVFMCPECRRIRREQRANGYEDSPL